MFALNERMRQEDEIQESFLHLMLELSVMISHEFSEAHSS